MLYVCMYVYVYHKSYASPMSYRDPLRLCLVFKLFIHPRKWCIKSLKSRHKLKGSWYQGQTARTVLLSFAIDLPLDRLPVDVLLKPSRSCHTEKFKKSYLQTQNIIVIEAVLIFEISSQWLDENSMYPRFFALCYLWIIRLACAFITMATMLTSVG
jgi:hypothetical protein